VRSKIQCWCCAAALERGLKGSGKEDIFVCQYPHCMKENAIQRTLRSFGMYGVFK
jgi:hypothetical protein